MNKHKQQLCQPNMHRNTYTHISSHIQLNRIQYNIIMSEQGRKFTISLSNYSNINETMKTLLNIQIRHKTKNTTKILHLQHLSKHLFISSRCKFLRVVAFSCSSTSLTGFKPPKIFCFSGKGSVIFCLYY